MANAESTIKQVLAVIAGIGLLFSVGRSDPRPLLGAKFAVGVLMISLPIWSFLLGQYIAGKRRKQVGFKVEPAAAAKGEKRVREDVPDGT